MSVLRVIADSAGLLLVALAVTALIHNTRPGLSVLTPMLVGLVGLAVVARQYGWWESRWQWPVLGSSLALFGGVIAVRSARPVRKTRHPVDRVVAALFDRRISYPGAPAPERIRVRAAFCRVHIDLSGSEPAQYGPTEIMISQCAAAIKIIVPAHWPAVAGRVDNRWGTTLRGNLDSTQYFDDPANAEQGAALDALASERQEATSVRLPGTPVVVHLMGIGGRLVIRHSEVARADPSPASSDVSTDSPGSPAPVPPSSEPPPPPPPSAGC